MNAAMWRAKRAMRTFAVLAVVGVLIVLDRAGWLLAPNRDDVKRYDGTTTHVVRVIDGDTLEIAMADPVNDRATTRVRLWGVDCPELARNDNPDEPLATEATAFARTRIEGAVVTLRLEPHRTRGNLGRLLAHVHGADDESLAEALLDAGLATADDRWPHARLTTHDQAERRARMAGLGIWGTGSRDRADHSDQ